MENQLEVIVKQSGLEQTKAQFILTKFQDYFKIAAEWETKAKAIIVTDENQKADMQMARIGRLFLREKRIAIEKARKELKEQALREGKAIDGIANVLKAIMEPIEEYLDKQERFIEIRDAEKAEQERIDAEIKAEQERIAKEKAEADERERIRLENIRLKEEVVERERLAETERKKQAEILEAEREEKRKIEAAALKAKAEAERKVIEARKKAEVEQKAIEEKARKEKEAERLKTENERKEKERLQKLLEKQITCPYCKKKFVPEQTEIKF